ncbi:MAG: hypothetical protein GWN73_34960, partial [Actinobacteria bacterium]|nr:hypothetical protein [Actinomycetota bacterium]NIU70295.1 hypothetical protein [Actinomycetota bacterium]NIW32174.1 hypothetical protein [Actinomycetota bacterium]
NPDSSWDDASLRRLSKEEAEWELDPLDYIRWAALTGHVELVSDPEFPSERQYPIASATDLSAPIFPSFTGDDGLVGDSDEITIGDVTVDLS